MAESMAENVALDEMEPYWKDQGYTLFRQPKRDQVPDFLGRYLPDAIATGREPGLIIEVINPRMPSAETKISQLRSLFDGHPDWKFEVVYTLSDVTELEGTSRASIANALSKAEQLADVEPRAALMLAWAGLEALGRALHPALSIRGMSSSKLIDLLVSHGNIEQSAQGELRTLAQMRNKIAHGQLDLEPLPDEVRRLVELARPLDRALS